MSGARRPADRRSIGAVAEARAAEHLAASGMRILHRNWRCKGGELDLVARDGRVLVFVEVRSRGGSARVGAAESIDARKRARVVRAAQTFVQRERLVAEPARFDVVAIEADGSVTHLRGAFDADG